MTTSSTSEPAETETATSTSSSAPLHQSSPLLDRKASSPCLADIVSSESPSSFVSHSAAFSSIQAVIVAPSTSSRETEFLIATVAQLGTATTPTTSSAPTYVNGFEDRLQSTELTQRQQGDTGSIDIQSSVELAPVPSSPLSISALDIIGPSSIGQEQHQQQTQQDAASYVLIGTHDRDPTAPSTTTSTAAASKTEADLRRSRRTPHLQLQQQQQQQQRKTEMGMIMGDEDPHNHQHYNNNNSDDHDHDNVTLTTPTTTSTSFLSHSDRNSIALASNDSNENDLDIGIDMSMTSPTRQTTKSSPTSSNSTSSSSGSTRRERRQRKIAESSMILSSSPGTGGLAGAMTAAGSGPPLSASSGKGGHGNGGSLSPAWSMTSIPRDISATYSNGYQHDPSDFPGSTVPAPMDEKLYGLVDRYGFLVEEGRTPTADKNARSPALSSSRRSVRAIKETKNQAKVVEKEQERSLKWAKMARQYTSEARETEYSFSNHSKFVSRVYKGIPDCWRAAAWSDLISKRAAGFEPNIRQMYHDMLEISSPEEEQIDLDIPRTMHGHIMFRARYGPGQCSLFKVLKAYSNYNHHVGYCQGMASVVATMLTFFDEEKTFVLLAQLFDRYNINDLVVPGFPALFEAFYIQEELTKIYAPKVFEALETMGIATPSYASRWYITLYSAGVVPYRTLLRIWDIFLLEGFDWLYFMALALLKYYESALIQNNFEQTMEMLNAKMDIQDDDRLLRIARKLSKQARQTGIVAKLKAKYVASQRQTAMTAGSSPSAV